LFVPRSRPALVSRPRLIERLNQAIEGKLTVVCAPAGFGKTTLLGQWLAGAPPAAWLSLDQKRQRANALLGLRRRRTADTAR
jgi:LuxR family transcriptional regulator, maltose regulon positive regulatory protein